MAHSNPEMDLRGGLAEVARPAERALRGRRAKAATVDAVAWAVPLIVVIPALHLLLCAALRGAGIRFFAPLWVVAVAAILLPLAFLAGRFIRSWCRGVSERAALIAVDDTLQLDDRLSAAHEFLGAAQRTPFMDAAIDDARDRIEDARGAEIGSDTPAPTWRPAHAIWVVMAGVAIILSTLVPVAPAAVDEDRVAVTEAVPGEEPREQPATSREPRNLREDPPRASREPASEAAPGHRRDGESSDTKSDKKPSTGQVGLGKSAPAQSAGGQSSGEGAASTQAQPTKSGSKKTPKKSPRASDKRSKKTKKRDAAARDHKESVASAGRGRGKGASRSPTASDWSSKDQIVTDEEEEFDEDEDVDDEDEESDARGGLQPNLRQRKPPVNRDLNIGFGGGKPPPFANGRGGPGLPKKQRGVAQLVLGVPFPDHVTGQPNPGMTKVTQERIEPQSSQSPPIPAEAREPRSAPMGRLSRNVLSPWMQDLIREFYSSLRDQPPKE